MPCFSEVSEGLSMPLVDAMETQRAIRRLRTDPVDDSTVLRCLELATKAPSGGARDSYEFIVVRDPEIKHQLARLNRQAWAVYRRCIALSGRSKDARTAKIVAATQWQADRFEEVPVIVVACARGFRIPFFTLNNTTMYGSVYPAVQNLLLAARSLGLGATLTTLPVWSTLLARRTLGLPLGVTPVAVVPLGWPQGAYGPTTRRPVAQSVHLNRYGNRAFVTQSKT